MNPQAGRGLTLVRNDFASFSKLVDARLRKLRMERRLVQKAIVALTKISQARSLRDAPSIRLTFAGGKSKRESR